MFVFINIEGQKHFPICCYCCCRRTGICATLLSLLDIIYWRMTHDVYELICAKQNNYNITKKAKKKKRWRKDHRENHGIRVFWVGDLLMFASLLHCSSVLVLFAWLLWLFVFLIKRRSQKYIHDMKSANVAENNIIIH